MVTRVFRLRFLLAASNSLNCLFKRPQSAVLTTPLSFTQHRVPAGNSISLRFTSGRSRTLPCLPSFTQNSANSQRFHFCLLGVQNPISFINFILELRTI